MRFVLRASRLRAREAAGKHAAERRGARGVRRPTLYRFDERFRDARAFERAHRGTHAATGIVLVRERVLLRAHTPHQTAGLVVIGERLLLRAQPFLVLHRSAHRAQRPRRRHARAHTARDAVCVPRLRLRRQWRRRRQRELVHLRRIQAEVHGE
jgi:hypothetical protein